MRNWAVEENSQPKGIGSASERVVEVRAGEIFRQLGIQEYGWVRVVGRTYLIEKGELSSTGMSAYI